MANEVVGFLRSEAYKAHFKVFNDVFGEICLDDNTPIKQSAGAVYGIFVKSEQSISKSKKVLEIPNLKNFYPVYWGKDINPTKRIGAHVQDHASTGNAKLRECEEIKGKKLFFGAIFVSNYGGFEKHLRENFPPLIGSGRPGRSSTIVEILEQPRQL